MTRSDPLYDRILEVIDHESAQTGATVEKDRLLFELQQVDVEDAEHALRDALVNGDLERRGRGYCLPLDRRS